MSKAISIASIWLSIALIIIFKGDFSAKEVISELVVGAVFATLIVGLIF